jgi:hypothetical protein
MVISISVRNPKPHLWWRSEEQAKETAKLEADNGRLPNLLDGRHCRHLELRRILGAGVDRALNYGG